MSGISVGEAWWEEGSHQECSRKTSLSLASSFLLALGWQEVSTSSRLGCHGTLPCMLTKQWVRVNGSLRPHAKVALSFKLFL